jgi:hypothetical protein
VGPSYFRKAKKHICAKTFSFYFMFVPWWHGEFCLSHTPGCRAESEFHLLLSLI